MALSDDCFEFVDDLRPKLPRFRECIAEYHEAPWRYSDQMLSAVHSSIERIEAAINVLDAVRRELDMPPIDNSGH
jgi:hypothetical protein